uniref:Putative rna-directed dna polymerase from mobile element jockey-like isoform x2 n=1 Tax=Xenopsylla cheopis TaxID=163159 RepID=A0A6M2DNA1_XENCH
MEQLRVLQLNCRSLVANKDNIIQFMNLNKIHIGAFSETWFKSNYEYRFKGYKVFRDDRTDGYGGTAILVKDNIECKKIQVTNQETRIQVCSVEVNVGRMINLMAIYCAPGREVDISGIKNIIEGITYPIILTGDFNCHHKEWGGNVTDLRGVKLYDIIDDLSLVGLNDGNPTTIRRHDRKPSSIDLTFCSSNLTGSINWKISEEVLGSDHLPIIITMNIKMRDTIRKIATSTWNMKKANWNGYSCCIDKLLKETVPPEAIEDKYKYLQDIIAEASKKNIGKNRTRDIPIFKGAIWWDSDCEEAIENRKKYFKIMRQNYNYQTYLEFQKVNAVTKRFLKDKKKKKWIEFTSNINQDKDVKNIWSIVRKFSNKNNTTNRSVVNKEFGEKLNKIYAPDWVLRASPDSVQEYNKDKNHSGTNSNNFGEAQSDSGKKNKDNGCYNNSEDTPLNCKIKVEELLFAIKKGKSYSPGKDGITYQMIKNSPLELKKVILEIFNEIIHTSWIPLEWRETIIVPILKRNKNPLDINSYRPISLLSCLEKIFERIIKLRLDWYVENKKILSNMQYGFRKGKGIIDILAIITNDIQISNANNEYLLLASIDIEKAYDNVEHSRLKEKLRLINIPNNIINLIINLISYRKIYVRTNEGLEGSRISYKGIPQGAILSPILFNIYMSDFEKTVHKGVKTLQYADDIYIYTSNKKYESCIKTIERSLVKKLKWFQNNNLTINIKKIQAAVFTRHRAGYEIKYLNIEDQRILIKNVIKVLGVHLDTKMSFKTHVQEIVKKCGNGINLLRILAKTHWGAHPSTCLMIYRACVRSHFDHAAMIYGNINNMLQRNLDKKQFNAIRICLGAIRSTPTNSLLAEAGEAPIKVRNQVLADRYLIKKLSNNGEFLIDQLQTLARQHISNLYWRTKAIPTLVNSFYLFKKFEEEVVTGTFTPYYKYPWRYIFPKEYVHVKEMSSINMLDKENKNKEFQNRIREEWQDFCQVYTDGSKQRDGVGSSYYIPSHELYKKTTLNKYGTIFTAELMAVNLAIDYIIQENVNKSIILIDSMSVVNAINTPKMNGNSLLYNTINKIERSKMEGRQIHIVWIRGHEGIVGNDIADELAKQASESQSSTMKIPIMDLKSVIKIKGLEQWQRIYEHISKKKGRVFSYCKPKVSLNTWFHNLKLDRKTITMGNRIRFNHTFLRSHLYRIGILDDPRCVCGSKEETADHLLWECTIYDKHRKVLYEGLQNEKIIFPINLRILLATNNKKIYIEIFNFLNKSNIRI